MYTQEVTINNEVGLHARPATYFIRKANEFKSGIWVEKDAPMRRRPWRPWPSWFVPAILASKRILQRMKDCFGDETVFFCLLKDTALLEEKR